MRQLWLSLALASLVGASACGTASEDVSTSTSNVLASEEAPDAGPVGPTFPLPSVADAPLVLGGPAKLVTYDPNAAFNATAFVAQAGQDLGFLVDARTAGTKPAFWITDNQFVSVAGKISASGSAYLRFTADRTGIYYLVLREVASKPSSFLVSTFDFTPVLPDAGTE